MLLPPRSASQTAELQPPLQHSNTQCEGGLWGAMTISDDTIYHGLSRRYDGSHHHECDFLWARSPIRERHIRWQIWHSKLRWLRYWGCIVEYLYRDNYPSNKVDIPHNSHFRIVSYRIVSRYFVWYRIVSCPLWLYRAITNDDIPRFIGSTMVCGDSILVCRVYRDIKD